MKKIQTKKIPPVVSSRAFLGLMTLSLAAIAHGQIETPPSSTALQNPLPNPALGLPSGDHPVKKSPGLNELPAFLRGKPLTIEDAVAVSLSTNQNLALQIEAFLRSKGVVTTTGASLGPSLSTTYVLDAYNNAQTANLGGQPVTISEQYQNEVIASLSLPIDLTGELRAALSQSKYLEIAAKLDIDRTRNEIVLNTKNAFYAVLRAQALVKVAQDALQNGIDRLADSKIRVDAGTSARFDLTTAKSEVATAQQTLTTDRGSLSEAFANLNNVMGIEVVTPLEITTDGAVTLPDSAKTPYVVPAIKPSAPPENNLKIDPDGTLGDSGSLAAAEALNFQVSNPIPEDGGFQMLLNEALHKRAEILRDDARIDAARKGITVAKSGTLPSLSLGYSYQYTPDVGALGQEHTGYGSLTLSFPIFDSGAARGRVTQARADVSTQETNRRSDVDSITLELREAYLNLQSAEISIKSLREALAQADEAYRLARLRYSSGVTTQPGVSPIVELSSAQQTLTQAQSNYVKALYDYNADRSALDKAIGRYSFSPPKFGLPKVKVRKGN
jgi:outer membrane protein